MDRAAGIEDVGVNPFFFFNLFALIYLGAPSSIPVFTRVKPFTRWPFFAFIWAGVQGFGE